MRFLFSLLTILLACVFSGCGSSGSTTPPPCAHLNARCAKAVQQQVNAKIGAQDECWIAIAEDVSGVQCWEAKAHHKGADLLLRIQITQHGKAWHVASIGRVDGTGKARHDTLGGTFNA